MCGIVGICSRQPLDCHDILSTLSKSLQFLQHRGPDDAGTFVSSHVALGAVRLKVLDLTGGNQPMKSDDGRVVLVFNGEIFNHQELRAELGSIGHLFRTTSDTEVVLRAYQQWGKSCLGRLRGMFGLAIWDTADRALLLARDQVGVKPLYYCQHRDELYFGSELKTIFAHPEVPRVLDLDALNCFLSLNYVPGPATLVRSIRKLMPGCLLEWRDGVLSIERYKGELPPTDPSWTLDSAKERLDSLLQRAVREQMAADVPLGIWASGGLDSSTLIHYAAQASTRRLRTFSVTFKGRTFDESEYIRSISTRYGTDHSEFDLNSTCDLADAIEQLSYYSDEPSADAGALPVWYLSKLCRKEVTVALSGEGADELFGGYLTYQADIYARWARILPRFALNTLARGARMLPVSDDKISFEYKLKRFLEGSTRPPLAAHVFWNGTFSEEQKRRFFRFADEVPMARFTAQRRHSTGIETFLRFDQAFYLPDDILYKADRMSMAHSLEVRPPFLDQRIVHFAASLPERLKVSSLDSKIVLRALMADRLPKAVLTRKKTGFDIPVHDWFRTSLRDFLLDTVNEDAVRRSGIFDWAGIVSVLELHHTRKANLGYHLWGIMTLLLWMKRWNVSLRETEPIRPASVFTMA